MFDRNLLLELKTHQKSAVLLCLLVLLNGFLLVAQANLIMVIINSVFSEGLAIGSMKNYFYCLLLALVLRSAVIFFHELLAHKIGQAVKYNLQQRILKKLMDLGPVALSSKQSGQLLNLVTEGISSLEVYFYKYLPQLVITLFIPLIILSIVFKLDFISGIILLITVPLMPLFMILIGKMSGQASSKQWQVLKYLSGHFLDVIKGLKTLKLFGRSTEQIEVIEKISNDFKDVTLGVLKIAFVSALVLELIATMGIAMVAVSIGLRLLAGEMVFSVAFLILLLIPEFYLPFRQLGTSFHAGMNAMAASSNLYQTLLLENDELKGSIIIKTFDFSTIEFQAVSYVYPDQRKGLQECNFKIELGEKVAVVGSSGAGKSTVLNLLQGLITPTAGSIVIDSIPLKSINLKSWSEHIICINQRPHIFATTILDNIKIANKSADFEAVRTAVQLADATAFIENLPQGYDTVVGEGGVALSGGQIRRISLARAFLSKAKIILLDEPMEGLDIETELAILKSLEKLSVQKTIIVVSHKLNMTVNFDKVILLSEGAVIECGTPAELIKGKSYYAKLLQAYRGIR